MSWQASSFVLLALALVLGFAWYERDKPPARVVALVAAMAALAVVGRLAFAAIPNVKPTTDIVLFAGYALGAVPGFVVGAVTAIVSNIFLSQGPWTAWQMAGWGAVGVAGALLARVLRGREPNRFVLAAVCGLAGLVFGAWMDVRGDGIHAAIRVRTLWDNPNFVQIGILRDAPAAPEIMFLDDAFEDADFTPTPP